MKLSKLIIHVIDTYLFIDTKRRNCKIQFRIDRSLEEFLSYIYNIAFPKYFYPNRRGQRVETTRNNTRLVPRGCRKRYRCAV